MPALAGQSCAVVPAPRRPSARVTGSTRVSFSPQPVENSVDSPVDGYPIPVGSVAMTADNPWTVRPQMPGIVRGRTVDGEYRFPHTGGNSMRVMWTSVDNSGHTPHTLHMHDAGLTCDDAGSPQYPQPL
jgi:hypothetical protein